MRLFLGLGSNVGDRRRFLSEAVEALDGVVAVSPVYESEPEGGPAGQGPYLNIVVELQTELLPRQVLAVCRRLEAAAGRVRGPRWGPRTLDVDILVMEGLNVDDHDLVVPHPRMSRRRFVMAPFADLAPELVAPGWERETTGSVRRLGRLENHERHPGSGGRNVEGDAVGLAAGD